MTSPSGVYIDSTLLVLYVVGSVDPELIACHRRLRAYTADDYQTLVDLIRPRARILVTPNTLTETSNLIAQHREPQRSVFVEMLRWVIENSEEVVVASAVASRNRVFGRLGLTDAALLEVITAETPLLTTDLGLYLAALNKHYECAVNFTHHRSL